MSDQIARAMIKAYRAFADTLERELGERATSEGMVSLVSVAVAPPPPPRRRSPVRIAPPIDNTTPVSPLGSSRAKRALRRLGIPT